jgi:hypothetical protein
LYKRKDADNDDDRNDQSFKTPNSIFWLDHFYVIINIEELQKYQVK